MSRLTEIEDSFLGIPHLKECFDVALRRNERTGNVKHYVVLNFFDDSGTTYVGSAYSTELDRVIFFDIDIEDNAPKYNKVELVPKTMEEQEIDKLMKRLLKEVRRSVAHLQPLQSTGKGS